MRTRPLGLAALASLLACGDPEPTETSAFAKAPLEASPSSTRVIRLTRTQYANTIADLFGSAEGLEQAFAPDALDGFRFDTSQGLRVDARLGPQYRAAAEQLAAWAVQDEAVLEFITPCSDGGSSCIEAFVSSFGERAFRRPLRDSERARFGDLFDQGADLYEGGDAFVSGVRITVEGMLQSPQFLYRPELGTGDDGDGVRAPLSDWEVASRLSYLIYDSMPDEALMERARQGELHTADEVQDAVERMLDDPRAREKLVSFQRQNWQFGRLSQISPDPSTFSRAPTDIVSRVRAATERFFEEVVAQEGGLEELLLAPYAFADRELAPLYGVQADSDDLVRIEFEDDERLGFLMQVGFLASHAYAVETDPIHRGLFVVRDLLCREVPEPPPGASMAELPATDEPIRTTREEIELLTGTSACASCHVEINPPGFAFEGFDAVGQLRTHQDETPVDTRGEIVLDGRSVQFDGPHDLVEALATSADARRCVSRRWIEFALGRPLSEDDAPMWQTLAAEPRSLQAMLQRTVTTPQFLTFALEEAE